MVLVTNEPSQQRGSDDGKLKKGFFSPQAKENECC